VDQHVHHGGRRRGKDEVSAVVFLKKLMEGMKCQGNWIQGFQSRKQETVMSQSSLWSVFLGKSHNQDCIVFCLSFPSCLERQSKQSSERDYFQEISSLASTLKQFRHILGEVKLSDTLKSS
jgi:hypothetical protein